MWEGQATSRNAQRLAGVALALLSLPFTALGAIGIWIGLVKLRVDVAMTATASVSLFVGVIALTIAYRIFFGRGVRQGGGVMSPLAFRFGGLVFVALAGFIAYQSWAKRDVTGAVGVAAFLFLSRIFFVAARHRAAMRQIQ